MCLLKWREGRREKVGRSRASWHIYSQDLIGNKFEMGAPFDTWQINDIHLKAHLRANIRFPDCV